MRSATLKLELVEPYRCWTAHKKTTEGAACMNTLRYARFHYSTLHLALDRQGLRMSAYWRFKMLVYHFVDTWSTAQSEDDA